ncbi:MAG TPA: Rieske 2Fe-2S domain-containing protein [candidate division Zixibacteria bacterium]|nr:Rieske 2Fe-2S domain-containing protein [candidate division Zixibacteria bacterium]
MKNDPDTGETGRSRLEPEPMARRDFLGLTAWWSAAAALLFGFLGAIRLPKAAVLPSPSKRFPVALPASLAPGQPYVPAGRSVAIYKEGNGVYAVSRICTHLGCIVNATESGFDCPCHGSKFAKDGTVLKGPAPKPLPWLEIKSVGPNQFLVDEGKTVPPGTTVTV